MGTQHFGKGTVIVNVACCLQFRGSDRVLEGVTETGIWAQDTPVVWLTAAPEKLLHKENMLMEKYKHGMQKYGWAVHIVQHGQQTENLYSAYR